MFLLDDDTDYTRTGGLPFFLHDFIQDIRGSSSHQIVIGISCVSGDCTRRLAHETITASCILLLLSRVLTTRDKRPSACHNCFINCRFLFLSGPIPIRTNHLQRASPTVRRFQGNPELPNNKNAKYPLTINDEWIWLADNFCSLHNRANLFVSFPGLI
jgi:hypothetical protein